MSERLSRALCVGLSVLCAAICSFLFFLPLPASAGEAEEYTVLWEDGQVTRERFSSAYSALCGADERGALLFREGRAGRIELKEEYSRTYRALGGSGLADLLRVRSEVGGIALAALWCAYGDTLWYDGDVFSWNGVRVERTDRRQAERTVLLSGSLPNAFLKESGATVLGLRRDAELSADALVGSVIGAVEAEAPWSCRDGGIYLMTAGGMRFVSALPAQETLAAEGSFFDRGALLPCQELRELTLPFLGGAGLPDIEWLFYGGAAPDALKKVTVRGGELGSFAFYGCPSVEEIDVCSVFEEKIAEDAFSGLPLLRRLHTKKRLTLEGFSVSRLSCGCYYYEKEQRALTV